MRGLGKFVFGGLVGVLIAIFVAPQRARQMRDALMGHRAGGTLELEPESVPVRIDDAWSYTPETDAGVVVPELEPEPVAVVEVEPELEPAYEPEPEPEPVAAEPQPEPEPVGVAAVEPEPESVAEAPAPAAPEPVAEPPIAPAPVEAGIVGGFRAPSFPVPTRPEPSPAAIEPVDEELVVEEQMAEVEPEVEPVVFDESLPIEAGLEQELPADVLVTEEQVADLAPAAEMMAVEAPVAGVDHPEAEAAVLAGTADLRARIEETRRRIQRELEHPFAPPESEEVVAHEAELTATIEDDQEYRPPVEMTAFAAMEPIAEVHAPSFIEPDAVEPALAATVGEAARPTDDEVERLIQDAEAAPAGGPGGATEFDHDAMRRRIEETRNRLKAKAFDAMMSGEGSLLSKSPEGTRAAAPTESIEVDSEVDQTIEATLTEEEF